GQTRRDLERPLALRRLLLGDVGSGKTAVAAGALLAAVAAKRQGLFVAPTDGLAPQHHAPLSQLLDGARGPLALLSGRIARRDAAAVRAAVAKGAVDVLV